MVAADVVRGSICKETECPLEWPTGCECYTVAGDFHEPMCRNWNRFHYLDLVVVVRRGKRVWHKEFAPTHHCIVPWATRSEGCRMSHQLPEDTAGSCYEYYDLH